MFGFLRKKRPVSPYAAVLDFPDEAFVALDLEILRENTPETIAMYVVTYENLKPILSACSEMSQKDNSVPGDIDDFLKMTAEEMAAQTNEIASRRWSWFWVPVWS